MDILDIVFRVEKTFGVEMSVDELHGLVRDKDIVVGDLYDHILTKLHLAEVVRNDIAFNYAVWHEMQDVVADVTGIDPNELELQTPLEELFPRKVRSCAWRQVRDTCRYRVRELDYPAAVRRVSFVLALAMVVVDLFHVWQFAGGAWVLPFLGFVCPLAGLVGLWMFVETYLKMITFFDPFRHVIPQRMVTMKDLCRDVLALNYADIGRDLELPDGEFRIEIWDQLTDLLSQALGIDVDKVTHESRIFRDLGAA